MIRSWSTHLALESGLRIGEVAAEPPVSAWGASRSFAIDRAVWDRLASPSAALEDLPGLRLGAGDALTARGDDDAVEVWIDRELAVMHGLWRAARTRRDLVLRQRLLGAVSWHLEHTGTENATHRPWALHVFLLEGSPEARLFAEGQLHACRADGGPDACSRWILADAAREMAEAEGLPLR